MVFLAVLILVATALLLDKLNAAVAPSPSRDPVSVDTLARAKDALIAWSATHPNTPGLLPFPDRNDDDLLATADAPARYDGNSDCDIAGAIASTHLLGRFPFAGEQVGCTTGANVAMSVDVGDSSGTELWYAVSQNLVLGGDGGLINPDIGELGTRPWITVRNQTGAVITDPTSGQPLRIAAVIIAPGPALAGQDRSATAPGAANYLDSLTVGGNTWNNADADGCPDVGGCGTPLEEFIINSNPQPGNNFNDRVVFITIDELMRAVEDRVLGEAVNALRSYQNSWTPGALPPPHPPNPPNPPNIYYPWMSTFLDPRSPQGTADAGSNATTLVDASANFIAAGLTNGDLVRNLTDGSIGLIAATPVIPTTLTLEGLIGGTANTFAALDQYVVHASNKFQGTAGNMEGMLPLHYPNEMFQTGFTVEYNFDDEVEVTGGDPSLWPDDSTAEQFDNNPLTVADVDGLCMWTQNDRVDCKGTAFFPGAGKLGTDRTVEVWFNFTADSTTIVAPTATTPRTRNHTLAVDTPYTDPIGPVPFLIPAGQTFSVRVIDNDPLTLGACPPLGTLTNCGWREVVPDFNTDVEIIRFEGVRYEISVGANQELPAWFTDKNWHQFIHGAISGANVPPVAGTSSGSGSCTPLPLLPTLPDEENNCLTIQYNATTVRDNVEALVIGPGGVLSSAPLNQDRNGGGPCTSQPAFLCEYFESPNSWDFTSPPAPLPPTVRNLVFGRAPANTFEVSTTFNDQIRAVSP